MENIKFGYFCEGIAKQYLIESGYKIINTNEYIGFYEIDIIGRDPDGIITFIEVKGLRNNPNIFLMPEDNMTFKKGRKIKNACELYVGQNPDLIDELVGWRIDLITVLVGERHARIKHYKNI